MNRRVNFLFFFVVVVVVVSVGDRSTIQEQAVDRLYRHPSFPILSLSLYLSHTLSHSFSLSFISATI